MRESPGDYNLANVIENNVIGPSPFNRRDNRITNNINGRNEVALKGKTTK